MAACFLSCSASSISISTSINSKLKPTVASLTNNPSSSPSPSPPKQVKTTRNPPKPLSRRRRRQRLQQQKPQPPTIIQIERAIGAGSFRDSDSSDVEEHRRRTVFDGLLPITGGKFEGDIERQLRQTGEFIGTRTEAAFRSNGKRILLVVLQWFLPLWTFALLVACGAIKLPFSTPFIDDFIM